MKEIKLENSRCYVDQVLTFEPGINLLIGDNTSGKTSMLKACKYALSAFFSGFKITFDANYIMKVSDRGYSGKFSLLG